MKKMYLDEELYIENIVFPNKGVAKFNGEEVFIKNTITGQKIKANIKRKKHKFEGRLIDILEKADYEINPKCDVFGICGGCTYQNIDYDKEIEIKKDVVLNLLNKSNIKDFEFLGINKAPNSERYRNKMEFSFGDTGEKGNLSLGMKKRGNYYEVVDASDCKIVSEDVGKILNETLKFFKQTKEQFYHRTQRIGSLRHLLVRQGIFTNEILVGIVTNSTLKQDLKEFVDNLLNLDLNSKIVGILHIINDSVSDVVLSDETRILYGRDYFFEEILGLKFKISTFSFFQTNSAGAEVLYEVVRKFADEEKNDIIFDLYCGTGTISQILSKNAKKVYGVEIVEEAIKSAKENAKLNNIENCEFIAGDVYKTIGDLNVTPDLIVLDPPREGIIPKAISKICKFGAKRLIYVSCKASSLAKDLNLFINNGYKVEKIEIVDMFPRTYHVETVVLMKKVEQ